MCSSIDTYAFMLKNSAVRTGSSVSNRFNDLLPLVVICFGYRSSNRTTWYIDDVDAVSMPLTKQYLRYEAAQSFGLVTGRKGDALLYGGPGSKGRRLAVCAALEDVMLWDMKTSSKVCNLSLGNCDVCLCHDLAWLGC